MIKPIKFFLKRTAYKFINSQKPDFLIIGAQKAGTTSLHYYLHQHPLLQGALGKELSFFSNDHNYDLGSEWYHSHFKDIRNPYPSKKTLFFESTPEYIYNKTALKRIYKYNRNLKLIIVLREPVSRAYSAWNMFRDFKSRPNGIPEALYKGYIKNKKNNLFKELYSTESFPTFEEAVESELDKINKTPNLTEPSFIRRGLYYEQINFLFTLFDESQLLVLDFNEFQNDKVKILNKTLQFLGKEDFDWKTNLKDITYNKRPYKNKIDETTKQRLKTLFKPHNKSLFKMINQKFDW
jgi:hypothetical protein